MIIFRHFSVSLLPAVITLTAFAIMCKLGFWQLDRAEHKRQQIEIFSQKNVISTQNLAQAAVATLNQLNGRNVELSGEIDTSKVWLLDNRTYQGKVGYSVVTPMTLDDSTTKILVNWGWIQAGQYRSELPNVTLPNSTSLTGTIRSKDFEQFSLQDSLGESGWPKRIQSISAILASIDKTTTIPVVVYADTNENITYPQTYKPVVMPPEKHQAYAVQWFLLALASVVVFIVASFKASNKSKKSENKISKESNEN